MASRRRRSSTFHSGSAEGMRFQKRAPAKLSGQNRCHSTGAGRRHSHKWPDRFIGRQILIGIELHCDATPLIALSMSILRITARGSRTAQHSPAAPHRHALRQRDFGRHHKSQFHNRTLRIRPLGIEKDSPSTESLSKSRHGSSFELNCQRQVHFETLRAAPLNKVFQTIGIGAHRISSSRSSLPHPALLEGGH